MVQAKTPAKGAGKAGEVKPRGYLQTNTFEVFRDSMTAREQWVAWVGPDSTEETTAIGKSPCSAIGHLLHKLSGGQYDFDPTWRPKPFE